MQTYTIQHGSQKYTMDERRVQEKFDYRIDFEKLTLAVAVKRKNPFALVGDAIAFLAAKSYCIESKKDFSCIAIHDLVANKRMQEFLINTGCMNGISGHVHYYGTIFEAMICLYAQSFPFFEGIEHGTKILCKNLYDQEFEISMESIDNYCELKESESFDLIQGLGKDILEIIIRQVYKKEIFGTVDLFADYLLKDAIGDANYPRFREKFLKDDIQFDSFVLGKLFIEGKLHTIDRFIDT